MQSIPPGRLAGPARRSGQAGPIVGSSQQGWHQEDLVPQGLQRGLLKRGRQTEPFEPIDEVVGQQE